MKFLFGFVSIFAALSLNAQRNIFDGFDDNSNGWPVVSAGNSTMKVMNGFYEVSSGNEGYWYYTNTVADGFKDHFRIEVSVKRSENTAPGKGVGLTWGNKGDSIHMAFLLYGDGTFTFQKLVNGKSQVVTNKGITFNILQEDFNNLRVERNMVTGMYDFSLNEQLVLSSPFEEPLSDEVGIYCDVAGSFQFDNFWFVEKSNTVDSYRPGFMTISDSCANGDLFYQSEYGFSFCVPIGWRVDNYKETHWAVWPVGYSYQVNLDYAKLALEDSFSVAAKGDFKIFVDSTKSMTDKKITPMWKHTSTADVEVYGGTLGYTDPVDKARYNVARYYVYHKKTESFVLIEIAVPVGFEPHDPSILSVARNIAETIHWE